MRQKQRESHLNQKAYNRKIVIGKNLKTNEIKIFGSTLEAAKFINGSARTIWSCCKGKERRLSHRGWSFIYADKK